MSMILKQSTFRSEKWLRAVAALPCVICGREGMTQAAHRNVGKGMGMKVDDCAAAALCQPCHYEIDAGSNMLRDERRATMDRAIVDTLIQLARSGVVVAS
ncbi:MAG: DUF968 domain-containing protein [Rhodospirillales bacterium]|nr:DUF968 domain-containing protein [Rhodospirillales bacterium]